MPFPLNVLSWRWFLGSAHAASKQNGHPGKEWPPCCWIRVDPRQEIPAFLLARLRLAWLTGSSTPTGATLRFAPAQMFW